ncbi:FAD-dependent monooxygenase [Streptomyces albireticuli]|uniref:FAD-dependent monooxygenase n=1 Tax=Streptomyces albireticuli TaxID=1940 RepID=UPI001E65DC70|nr:FAD-dependent monooxygenase [Streptomyces albireticuli]MCD9141266.1 FAD-dependent monooxygenase [Streptomyces albireticuli]MCD9160773.1 FAD-dependent monooxygenase [Streptomyces albireticuli]MCD9191170.1 FAD-dependent monooxygenase [Streptomyces albireticuli]
MPVADTEVAVLIVGGGPVGLTARVLLERWGVRSLLVERHRELSPFPRARLVNVRSMEIFRGLGLAAGITARAFAPEYGRIRFRDTLYDRDFATAAMAGVDAPVPESPATGVVTSQDRLEPLLLAAADTPVRFGAELVDLAEEPDGVVASLVDHRSGHETRVRARYVLAADGANSTVRQRLGIDTSGPGAMGGFTTVVFDADLSRWCARRPAGVYFTAHGSFTPLYPEGGWAWFGPTPEDAAHADWPGLVSRALGPGADVRVEVVRVQHWVMNASVAERFRHGRNLLAGDAAHAIPIIGGLGMNTGIADAHNLCWKLAGVLHGWAAPGLLDTYEAERHPVALRTLRQAVANAQLALHVQNRRREQLRSGETVPSHVELPWSKGFFAQLGLVLGAVYRSGAVLAGDSTRAGPSGAGEKTEERTEERADEETHEESHEETREETHEDPDAGTEYVPTAEPGHRMPHLRLARDRSTLDAFGEWFTLLTPDPSRWARCAAAPWPLRVETLPGEHAGRCGIGPSGALLIRPDGHVGARWPDRPPSDATLQHALATLTGQAPS